jgi:hypothetical protein
MKIIKIKYKNPIPYTPEDWLKEITDAYLDAKGTIPFAPLTGEEMTENDLYHLAPVICLKFRGIKQTKDILKQATEIALSNYVANLDAHKESLTDPYMAFSLCYVTSHFGLEIIDENQVESVMYYLENTRKG